MPTHTLLTVYVTTWAAALLGNALVELTRLRSERGVPVWIDYTGFALTVWLVLPILPLVAMVVSLQRRDWLSALLRVGSLRSSLRASPALAANTRG